MMELSVSYLSARKRQQFIKEIEQTSADFLHVDVMDGVFVKNQANSLSDVEAIKALTTKPLDIHLMVKDVIPAILKYRTLNPAYLTFHIETVTNPLNIIELIHTFNIKAGMSIKPGTNLNQVIPYLKHLDLILIMGVEPGAGGQDYLINTTNKINELKDYINHHQLTTKISVDGGINPEVIKTWVVKPDIIVVGSYLNSDNIQTLINKLKKD